jgi:hypothetical protein
LTRLVGFDDPGKHAYQEAHRKYQGHSQIPVSLEVGEKSQREDKKGRDTDEQQDAGHPRKVRIFVAQKLKVVNVDTVRPEGTLYVK